MCKSLIIYILGITIPLDIVQTKIATFTFVLANPFSAAINIDKVKKM